MTLTKYTLDSRMRYYTKIYVLFEIIKAMKNREVIFMDRTENWKCIRGLYVKSIDFLKYAMQEFNFFEKDYNIYISTARYNQIPTMTYNLKNRKQQTQHFFNSMAHREIFEFDALLDFDRKKKITEKQYKKLRELTQLVEKTETGFYHHDFLGMFAEVKIIHQAFLQYGIKHYIIPSGNNFQMVIPSEVFSFERKFSNIATETTNFNNRVGTWIQDLKQVFNLQHLDTIGTSNFKKIMKCPYSLVKNRVCLPLLNLELFNYNDMVIEEILKNVNLAYRGIFYFKDGTPKICRERMIKFSKKFCLEVD